MVRGYDSEGELCEEEEVLYGDQAVALGVSLRLDGLIVRIDPAPSRRDVLAGVEDLKREVWRQLQQACA